MTEKLYHILVIDDDTRLRNLLGRFLDENGFHVSLAKDTEEAKSLMQSTNFNLLIVDVMLQGESGVDFTDHVRQSSKMPIVMLTARGEAEDRIRGLEAGADDYIQKPFEPKELLLRINNILKRANQFSDDKSICRFGSFTFNYNESRLKNNAEFIHITDSEAKILTILCKEKGKVVLREKLSSLCGEIDERSIDVQITRLRKKIESNPKQPKYLQTVRNHGYVLYG
jgi:two-component system, OmpR family, phosphate regulon response regulator OmpR